MECAGRLIVECPPGPVTDSYCRRWPVARQAHLEPDLLQPINDLCPIVAPPKRPGLCHIFGPEVGLELQQRLPCLLRTRQVIELRQGGNEMHMSDEMRRRLPGCEARPFRCLGGL